MIKLSIIVPVYNVEKYLRKCVDGLLAQDISDYEIILVDDGSTDNSGAICDNYASPVTGNPSPVTPLIRVIHQPNGGLSAARNSGIKVAQGEYLMFVDSDDYIEPNVLGSLVKRMDDEQLDVLRFNYQNVRLKNEREYEVFEPNKTPHKVDTCSKIVDGETYLNTRMGYACYAWQFIVRRDLITNDKFQITNVQFTPGLHFEDVDWLPRMMLRAQRVNSTTRVVYNYFWREGSITLTQGNKEKIRRNLDDRISIIENYRELRKQNSTCMWLQNMQSIMVAGVLTTVAQEFYAERKEYIKKMLGLDVFPLAITNQSSTYVRRAHILNILGPRIYCILMNLRKKLK